MQKSRWSVKTLVFMALLVALHLILTRILALDLGPFRITIGPVCTIMAGLWLGPVAGATCGFTADIIGCFMKGYAINPFITLAAMTWGLVPALMKRLFLNKSKGWKVAVIIISIAISSVVSTLLLNTIGLVLLNGYSLMAIVPGRITQLVCNIPVYSIVTSILYFSPLTNIVMTPDMVPAKR